MFGCGCGESISNYYICESVDSNANTIMSPSVTFGVPFLNQTLHNANLLTWLNQSLFYSVNGQQMLWRISLGNLPWRATKIDLVDLSIMMFGLAYSYCGSSFQTAPVICHYCHSSCLTCSSFNSSSSCLSCYPY